MLRWVDWPEVFDAATKEGNRYPNSRPTIRPLSKINKVLTSGRWRRVSRAAATRSNRISFLRANQLNIDLLDLLSKAIPIH